MRVLGWAYGEGMTGPRGDLPTNGRRPEKPRGSWPDYQRPLRWDWSAAGVIVVILLAGALLAALVLHRL